jgi:drug/metabolite transporter (DMT)-like permease
MTSRSKDQSSPAEIADSPSLDFVVRGHVSLLASILLGVASHLILKFGVLQVQAQPGVLITYLWIVLGLVVYAAGTGCWMLCLSRLDLSYAYPFTGLSYVLIFVASSVIFGDRVSLERLGGILVVCLGITFISSRSRS